MIGFAIRQMMNYRIIKQTMPLIMVLRKRRNFSFLLLVNRATCDSESAAMSTSSSAEGSHGISITNGLLLYHHEYSYYSQKVVMALHEKKLPFEECSVSISSGEQYKPWFLQINPRGEVPVLQDTGKIIPDSGRIIDYLEDNFSNGDTPRLIPMDQGSEIRQKVTYFRGIIDKVPANVVTMGSFSHPEFSPNPKIPFIAPVRMTLLNSEKNGSANLKARAEENPEAKAILLQKAAESEKKYKVITNRDEYVKVLAQIDGVLDAVEKELNLHINEKTNWWLCTDRFTVADVALTILLQRLYELGLESHFWTNNKRPNIEKYFVRVRERDSYKKTIPNKWFLLKTIIVSQSPLIIGVSIAVSLAVLIVGGVFIVKKLIL